MSRKPRGQRARENRLRIIGGEHRGRRLVFPDLPDLRPSPDRVRETLFNWLGPAVVGARCVDLYAGSGALGLEALSRGAAHCHFVDRSATAVAAIQAHVSTLALAERAQCTRADAQALLAAGGVAPADLYFIDPPFAGNHWERLCTLLDQSLTSAPALVYLEHPAHTVPDLPPTWQLRKQSRAGAVGFRLAQTAVATRE